MTACRASPGGGSTTLAPPEAGSVRGPVRRGPVRGGRHTGRRGAGERGAGGLWVVWTACLVWCVAVAAVMLGGAVAARHRAAAAADLAALAAAERATRGPVVACRAAAGVATRMDTRMASCTLDGLVADVEVTARVTLPGGDGAVTTVRARAGPDAGSPPSLPSARTQVLPSARTPVLPSARTPGAEGWLP